MRHMETKWTQERRSVEQTELSKPDVAAYLDQPRTELELNYAFYSIVSILTEKSKASNETVRIM